MPLRTRSESVTSDVAGTGRPRIGLTTYLEEASWGTWKEMAALLPQTYVHAVVAAGGTPVLLPPTGTDPSVVEALHGLIISGGSDVGPEHYGDEPHELTRTQPARDLHDIALIKAALQAEVPLLAICRGAQILNVALGGSLFQHIPDFNPEADYQPAPGVFGTVDFRTTGGSITGDLLGPSASAPCYHHQAINRLADGLYITAAAADGTVEAVETATGGWALGVQFHPEQNPADLRLFEGFIEAARRYRTAERRTPALSTSTFAVLNAATKEVIETIALATLEGTDRAITQAT
ncbi:gamma-glutamyl-gamma-aminobutyrate hydrolase family protein [Arthrobacter sp. IIF3SC--B10]|uniref:Gamma-glutamyl-gamma-aminobutyrate hydrolase family protein n=2 Tax=Arthrobacter burdickii TaxID=3035920 RepID=A0ABT8K1M8_9MICC|nr:gamma-glutamyl-gamma-aminobutyrate hydrolase family protein [Arthrobacter burdickii]MDN4610933.1 gamma-glutamyl-gamma-aminobutyrate hydrolase family protein [Arthrobacter burdickii]